VSEDLRADVSQLEVAHTAAMEWAPSPAVGVERKRLERMGPVEAGRVTSVVRYAAGSRFHSHPHPDGEEILVLEGVFSDERGDHPAGTYLLNPEGYSHAPFSESGCVLFVKLRQYPGQRRTSVRVEVSDAAFEPYVAEGIERAVLYAEPEHPEQMHVLRLSAGVTTPRVEMPGGEELFVLEGSCHDGDRELVQGSWVRYPPGSTHRLHTERGCRLYVKKGHLARG
jgi:anti-sigma factor ChrR (cupin superfamily)